MYQLLLRAACGPRLLWMIASVLTPLTFTFCGGGNSTAHQSLPPPIPASQPVLLFVGTGTSSPDVEAVEAVLRSLSLGFNTADSGELDAMNEQQIAGYKLLIIPGGNSIEIGGALGPSTATNIRGAVADYGIHYLGICAGAFFGGYSSYNGVNLTNGVPFDFYTDEFKGIHVESVEISLPGGSSMNVYWQDGPQLSGWGDAVAKFPDGSPAITEGLSGNGFVVFTGVHLEAPASWLDTANFTSSVSQDMAYAGTIVQAAFNGTPLDHF